MYLIESYSSDKVLIVNSEFSYRSEFSAENEDDRMRIVVGLNKPDLLQRLLDYRFRFETGGLSVVGGLNLLTDRESQAQLSSAFVTLQSELVPDTDWKAANGWQVVNLEQIKPIATAVAAHLRGCFRGERKVQEEINAAKTMAEIEAIDIQALFQEAYRVAFEEVVPPGA